eukprot:COSAG02_NODE_2635_length_8365_cov_2.690056_5_plen_185_part_00
MIMTLTSLPPESPSSHSSVSAELSSWLKFSALLSLLYFNRGGGCRVSRLYRSLSTICLRLVLAGGGLCPRCTLLLLLLRPMQCNVRPKTGHHVAPGVKPPHVDDREDYRAEGEHDDNSFQQSREGHVSPSEAQPHHCTLHQQRQLGNHLRLIAHRKAGVTIAVTKGRGGDDETEEARVYDNEND